jgi:hypothetical protein
MPWVFYLPWWVNKPGYAWGNSITKNTKGAQRTQSSR